MYRLLIVDDEPMVTDSLYDVIKNADNLDLDIYKAYSGVEAIAWLNRTKIDIVLTDIRMPGITGLQLLDEIYKNWPQSKVIFLTGYDEFEYVYKAIQYKGVSYLLKTEPYEKIIQAVRNAAESIEESLKMEEVLKGFDKNSQIASELIRKEYLLEVLNSHAAKADSRQQSFDRLSIGLNASFPVFLLIGRIDDLRAETDYEDRSDQFLAVKHIAEKYLSQKTDLAFTTDEKLNLIWLIQPKNPERNEEYHGSALFISGMLETIQSASLNALKLTVSFLFTEIPYMWADLPEKYRMSKEMLNLRIGDGKEMILTAGIPDMEEYTEWAAPADVKNALSRLREKDMLEAYLERGDREAYLHLLNRFTGCFGKIKSMHYLPAQQIYMTLATMILSYINRFNLMKKVAFKIDLYRLTHIEEYQSWGQAADYLADISGVLFDIQSSEQQSRTLDVMNEIKAYIAGHIAEDLSLVRLSETFHFNSSYLSRLFKQEEGLNLSEYIFGERLEKAKKLLSGTDWKVLKISETVGYNSTTSFGRVFKRSTGFTPQEYRELQNR